MSSSKGNRKKRIVERSRGEMIKRRINTTGPQKTDQEDHQGVEDSFPDSDELVARAKLSISINETERER